VPDIDCRKFDNTIGARNNKYVCQRGLVTAGVCMGQEVHLDGRKA
jgi:hypothetical protein